MNNLLKTIFIVVVCFCFSKHAISQGGSKIETIVIDAGHGGKDPGALGKKSKEKDIALAVALKTGAYIEKNLPDVKVLYTREDDRFIPLHKRAEIANKNNADFFISIHCNALEISTVTGAETYVMGLHKNDQNLNVAMKENAAILFEENAETEYSGFDANSDESYIQFNLFQDENLDQSTALAGSIQMQFKDRVGRKDRSVKQAGFLVLWRTAMPGVLIELGYISNADEEKFLLSENGQVYMASAVYRAFRDYKKDYEKENGHPKTVIKKVEPTKKTEKAVEEKVIVKDEKKTATGVNYRVQFYTNPRKVVLYDKRFNGVPELEVYFDNAMYKYTSGHFNTIDDARRHLPIIKNLGYSDAFVAAFDGDERISFSRAQQLIGGK